MERDAFPSLGDKLVTEITAPEIPEAIRIVEARGALDISRRLKQGVSQIFRFAIASGWATEDSTVHLTGALKRVRESSTHSSPLMGREQSSGLGTGTTVSLTLNNGKRTGRAGNAAQPSSASEARAAARRSMLRRKTARIGDGLSARYPAAISITGPLPVSGRLTSEAGSSACT